MVDCFGSHQQTATMQEDNALRSKAQKIVIDSIQEVAQQEEERDIKEAQEVIRLRNKAEREKVWQKDFEKQEHKMRENVQQQKRMRLMILCNAIMEHMEGLERKTYWECHPPDGPSDAASPNEWDSSPSAPTTATPTSTSPSAPPAPTTESTSSENAPNATAN